MDQGTMETRDNVRRAEEELASVRAEVTRVVARWTNTVININKVTRVRVGVRVMMIVFKWTMMIDNDDDDDDYDDYDDDCFQRDDDD